jgi:hypothetical protein
MNLIRIISAGLVLVFFVAGYLMEGTPLKELGHTLILAGAIILAGLLISLAIVEKNR